MIHAVNATSVQLRWAGRRFFYTSVKYTSIFSNTGLAISHYEAVLPPYVDFAEISLDGYHPGYEHHFTLSYVICNVVPANHQATATFAFGKLELPTCLQLYLHGQGLKQSYNIYCVYRSLRKFLLSMDSVIFVVHITDKKHFQVQFGPMEHCLNWGVSL